MNGVEGDSRCGRRARGPQALRERDALREGSENTTGNRMNSSTKSSKI